MILKRKMHKRKQHTQTCLEAEFVGEASGSGSPLPNPSVSFNEEKESHRGYRSEGSSSSRHKCYSLATASPISFRSILPQRCLARSPQCFRNKSFGLEGKGILLARWPLWVLHLEVEEGESEGQGQPRRHGDLRTSLCAMATITHGTVSPCVLGTLTSPSPRGPPGQTLLGCPTIQYGFKAPHWVCLNFLSCKRESVDNLCLLWHQVVGMTKIDTSGRKCSLFITTCSFLLPLAITEQTC